MPQGLNEHPPSSPPYLILLYSYWTGFVSVSCKRTCLLIPLKQRKYIDICMQCHYKVVTQNIDNAQIFRYNVLRRLLPLSSLLFACCMLKKKPSIMVVTAVVLVVLGCIIAGTYSWFFIFNKGSEQPRFLLNWAPTPPLSQY